MNPHPEPVETPGLKERLQVSAVDASTEALRVAIVDGEFPAGSRLVEMEITARLGVSRNTVREVFRILQAERLIEREAHRGVVVRTLTPESIKDVFVVRRLAETGAIREAASAPLGTREECCRRMRAALADAGAALKASDAHRLAAADLAFHGAVAALAGSGRLVEVISAIKEELRLAFGSVPDRVAFHAPYVARNAEICELVENGEDEAAANVLHQYLIDSEAQIIALLTE